MNKRIKELAEQAGYKHPDAVGECEDYAYFDHEEFAELIIQDLIDSMIKRYGDDDELPIQEIKLFVREHFGVKA